MTKNNNKLVALAEKGSLQRFSACLFNQDHAKEELFDALRTALLWNQAEKARLLLEAGADALKRNKEEDQLLTHAAIGGNLEIVRLMINKGCDPNHRNINQRTALHNAARSGRLEAIRLLIEQGANVDSRDSHGQTPLTEALSNRHYPAAIELIQSGADLNVRAQPMSRTPLMMAASGDSPELVELILEKGANLEEKDDNGCTPLMYAARAGRMQVAQILIDAGADLYAKDSQGQDVFQWTSSLAPDVSRMLVSQYSWSPAKATEALLKAASESDVQNIEILLDKGAQIQPAEEGGESALAKALFSRSIEGLKILLASPSVDIDYRCGKFLRTALCLVPFTGRESIEKAKLLLGSGADPGVVDVDGMAAIHHAAAYSHLELIRLLHQSGANIFARDQRQRTLLHIAIRDSGTLAGSGAKLATLRWLLRQGLHPGIADMAGVTPLMLTAMEAREDIAGLLIEAGADVDAVDEQGHTALYQAVCHGTENGYNDRYVRPKSKKTDPAAPIIETLLSSGVDPNKCDILSPAGAWRWPGAVAMLKRYGANK